MISDWDDLRYVLAVARRGSLSRAAADLRVNHSTVFRRLSAIEDTVGVPLFERGPDGYVATVFGDAVVRAALAAETAVSSAERTILGSDAVLEGAVRVTTTEDVAIMLLARPLAAFATAHPGIEVTITVSHAFFNLSRREADVAIRPSREPAGDMVGRRVARLPVTGFAASSYLAKYGRPTTPEDLADHRLIAGDDDIQHVPSVRWLERHVGQSNVALRSNSFLVQRKAVAAGLGVAVLPTFLAVGLKGVEPLWPALADLDSELWLLTHPDLRRNARIRTFLDFMYGRLRRDFGRAKK